MTQQKLQKKEISEINLIPRVISNVESRNEVDIYVNFHEWTLKTPIIASPMKDVCDGSVALKMANNGGLGIIHRFCSIEEQIKEFKKACSYASAAIGVNGDWKNRFISLHKDGECRLFTVDTANGANQNVKNVIEYIYKYDKNVKLIVGNVVSKECYQWLEQFPNVIAIRCLIGSGRACSTTTATGIHYPSASCIQECASVKQRTLLIADGGINEPADMCKCLALGADIVMLGQRIAATSDSPAELIKKDGRFYKVYHGSASFEIQKEYRDKPRYIEGKTVLLDYEHESLEDLLVRFNDGLRSSMSYFNATNLKEYRNNVTFE